MVIKFFNCSQNFAFARFARKISTSARLLVLAKFCNCSHARILVKINLLDFLKFLKSCKIGYVRTEDTSVVNSSNSTTGGGGGGDYNISEI